MADAIGAFWEWFRVNEERIRTAFDAGVAAQDYPSLEALVREIGDALAPVTRVLGVRLNGGGGAFQLAIQAVDPEQHALARKILDAAPAIAAWTFTEAIQTPPKNIITRDGEGRELVVGYAEVRFTLLPPKPDGTISVIFVIDRDFDPQGELSHLYRATATELLKNTFGGVPTGMGSYALVPASWVDAETTRPIDELGAAWRATSDR